MSDAEPKRRNARSYFDQMALAVVQSLVSAAVTAMLELGTATVIACAAVGFACGFAGYGLGYRFGYERGAEPESLPRPTRARARLFTRDIASAVLALHPVDHLEYGQLGEFKDAVFHSIVSHEGIFLTTERGVFESNSLVWLAPAWRKFLAKNRNRRLVERAARVE